MTEKTASDMKMVASKLMKLSEAITFVQLLKQSQDARFKVLKGKYPNRMTRRFEGNFGKRYKIHCRLSDEPFLNLICMLIR